MLALFLPVPHGIGYPLLFAIVAGESAGLLLPGETALIVAATLAADGKLDLGWVIGVAAAGAIAGDNIGYVLGRRGLRTLFERPGRSAALRRAAIARAESFAASHGPVMVFAGRWLPGLRLAAAWVAGMTRMPWARFLFWNTTGGVAWAATVGVLAYEVGDRLTGPLGFTTLALVGLLAVGFGARTALRAHREPATVGSPTPERRTPC